MSVRKYVRSVARVAQLFILLSLGLNQSRAQQPATIVGDTQRIEPPHVSEPWSMTASTPSSERAGALHRETVGEDERDIPGFAEAKSAANARKFTAMSAQGANAGVVGLPSSAAATPIDIVVNTFIGPANGVNSPPDLQIAAGAAHFVTAINLQLDIFNKSGVHLSTTQFATFFSSVLQGGSLTD